MGVKTSLVKLQRHSALSAALLRRNNKAVLGARAFTAAL